MSQSQHVSIPAATRPAIALTMAAVLAIIPVATACAEVPQARDVLTTKQAVSRAEYEACQAQDEAAFRTAIQAVTRAAFRQGVGQVNYDAIVTDAWRAQDLGRIVDVEVNKAVAEVRDETSWGTLIRSLADKERAQELATAVAERVYRSDAIKAGIEALAADVGSDVGRQIEIAAQDAAKPALGCLQAFVGPRYGAIVATAVVDDAGDEFGLDATKTTSGVTPGAVLRESTGGLTGAAILLVRRQLANMARRIGARLVGSVLSRLVSVVAGGVGVVLIAKDLWDLRNGVLPIIATEMKAETTKRSVREELSKSIDTEMRSHVDAVADKTADRIVAIWREFRSAHQTVLALSDSNETFKSFLSTVNPQRLSQLDQVVAIIKQRDGEPGIMARLQNGTLDTAVNRLPQSAMAIARETRDLDVTLRWAALAGSDLDRVVAGGIYRNATPDAFTKSSLQRLLGLTNQVATQRLAALTRETRTALFALDDAELERLARRLEPSALAELGKYLIGLDAAPRERVLRAVAADPQTMARLAPPRVRAAIVASADQSAAVAIMLRADEGFNPMTAAQDFQIAWDGTVSPILLWEKHPGVFIAAVVALLMLLLLLRRLFRRPNPAPKAVTNPAGSDA